MATTSVLYSECLRRRCVTKKCNAAQVEFYNNRLWEINSYKVEKKRQSWFVKTWFDISLSCHSIQFKQKFNGRFKLVTEYLFQHSWSMRLLTSIKHNHIRHDDCIGNWNFIISPFLKLLNFLTLLEFFQTIKVNNSSTKVQKFSFGHSIFYIGGGGV